MEPNIGNSFSKEERLKSKIEIDYLFAQGTTFFVYPFKVIYSISECEEFKPARIVISIPKRKFKLAVSRNLLRRRAKEAYRLNKQALNTCLLEKSLTIDIMLIYSDYQNLSFQRIEKGIVKILSKLISELNTSD